MVHQVDAGASVLARLVLALVHLVLAVHALVAWDTLPGASKEAQDMSDWRWGQRVQGRLPQLLPHLPGAVLHPAACGCPALTSSSQKSHFKGQAAAEYGEGASDVTPVQNCGLPVGKFCHL